MQNEPKATKTTITIVFAVLYVATAIAPVQAATDVLVYGGTSSGVIAAVAAAREGASVVLLEPGKHLGGMVSGGLGWGDVNRPEVVGGLAREYFLRVGKAYGKNEMVWHIEPHVAEQVFIDMAREAGVKVVTAARLRESGGVKVENHRVIEVTTESGETYAAKTFIDASYEGDLMAQAGVKYRIGREAISEYNEPSAGVRKLHPLGQPGIAVDDKGVLPLVYTGPPGEFGSDDAKVQDYNFRLCLTRDPANRVPIKKPANYDPRDFELLARIMAKSKINTLAQCLTISPIPNGKTDINNGFAGVSTDLVNGSWKYPNGSYAERARIWQRHKDYTLGLLWFLGNDPRVPKELREETSQWGLAKDEFVDNENFPYQLYIREGRRMVGDYVMTEKDCRDDNDKDDSIAMGSYMLDCHGVQRVLLPGNDYAIEGSIGGNNRILPYEIPYRSLTPKKAECENLIVPLCMSASHVAWASVRMEPQFMLMGHAAGVAAAMASHEGAAVQSIDVAQLRAKLKLQGQVMRWKMPGAIDPKTLKGIVMDDGDAKFTGTWKSSNAVGPFVGISYRYAENDGEKHAARFVPALKPGRYELRMFYTAASNRATKVKVIVHRGEREAAVIVDQKKPMPAGGLVLGQIDFAGDGSEWAEINSEGADGIVVADALQWLPAADGEESK